MPIKAFLALSLLLCLFTAAVPQTKAPAPPQKSADDDVVRITTNLVQVDAVVTKDGKIVPNLTADDFEIYEDGKKQTITSFAFISNVANQPAKPTPESRANVPFTPFKRDEPHRTIAFVVDDLGLSAESMYQVRRQLRKFVAEELQPNDLVAIIRTGGELGVLQQFTTDKRLLNRAVDRLRWNFCSRVDLYVFMPIGRADPPRCGSSSQNPTIKSLRFIIDAMGRLPGRKSMVLMSDSLPIQTQDELLKERSSDNPVPVTEGISPAVDPMLNTSPEVSFDRHSTSYTEMFNKLAEKAVRASVVIYSVDTQALAYTGVTAADSIRWSSQSRTPVIEGVLASRSRTLIARREGGDLLARQTGGFQIRNSNDFQLDRIMQDQSGYYLLGYRPTEETFNRRFHHIKAKVKRSGMTLRTRYGFFGFTEEEVTQKILTPKDLTNLALASPFAPQDIELDLTTYFADHRGDSSLVRSFVNIDLKDLTFKLENGNHEAAIEIHGVIFGDNGSIVQQLKNGARLRFSESEFQQALQSGFQLSVDMPVKGHGSYQVRVAIRDRTSSKFGSAGGFVAVPNLKNKQLAASGIVLATVASSQAGAAGQAITSPGARRFQTNSDLQFTYRIYNSAVDGGSQLRNMVMEAKLFRDGKNVFSSPEAPVVARDQQDPDRVVANGVVRLSPDLEPGNYYLQVLITEKGAKSKKVPVEQWIDFEIVK